MRIRRRTKKELLKELENLFQEFSKCDEKESRKGNANSKCLKVCPVTPYVYLLPGTEYLMVPETDSTIKKHKKAKAE